MKGLKIKPGKIAIDHNHIGIVYQKNGFVDHIIHNNTEKFPLTISFKDLYCEKVNITTLPSPEIIKIIEKNLGHFDKTYTTPWETNRHQMGLFFKGKKLIDLSAPGQQGYYWNKKLEFTPIGIEKDEKAHLNIRSELRKQLNALSNESAKAKEKINQFTYSVKIERHHIGILINNEKIAEIVEPGYHMWWDVDNSLQVNILSSKTPIDLSLLVELKRANIEPDQYIYTAETQINQIGLLYRNGMIADIIPPQNRQAYWTLENEYSIKHLSTSDPHEISEELNNFFLTTNNSELKDAVSKYLAHDTVKEGQVGYHIYPDGRYQELGVGVYTRWKFNTLIQFKRVETNTHHSHFDPIFCNTLDNKRFKGTFLIEWLIEEPEAYLKAQITPEKYLEEEITYVANQYAVKITAENMQALHVKEAFSKFLNQTIPPKMKEFGLQINSILLTKLIETPITSKRFHNDSIAKLHRSKK